MMKKQAGKLVLSKETLRNLEGEQLAAARGMIPYSLSWCITITLQPDPSESDCAHCR